MVDRTLRYGWVLSGSAIYDNFTRGTGPGGLSDGSGELAQLAEEQQQDFEQIRALTVKMEAAWQGEASGAAQRGLVPFAAEHYSSAMALDMTSGLLTDQAGSFGSAKTSVVPVPPKPDRPPGLGMWLDKDARDSYETGMASFDGAEKHNVSVMISYEGSSEHNTHGLPSTYGSMTPDVGTIGVAEPAKPGSAGGRQHGHAVAPHVSGVGGGGSTTTRSSGTRSPGQATAPITGGQTTPAGGGALPASGGSASSGGDLPSRPGGGSVAQPVVGAPGWNSGAPGAGPGRPGSEAVPGRPGSGGGAVGGDDRVPRPGGRSAEVPRQAPGAGAEPLGARTGRGVIGGGVPEAEALAGRGGAGGSRGGATGAMPVGGGSGRRGEDEERERRGFFVEAEPEELFGTDEVTAPSVIE